MAEQSPGAAQDPFDPLPRKGDRITAPPLKADEPTQKDEKAPTTSDKKMQRQSKKGAPKPSAARKQRGVGVEESQKVTKAASDATKSEDELRASDRGPEQAVDTNQQPLTAAVGPTLDVEQEAPPETPDAPASTTPPLKTKRTVQRKDDQSQGNPQPSPDQRQKEQPRDAAASTERSEQKAESPMKDVVDALKAVADVLLEIRNDQRELLFYAREASTQQGGLGSQP